jgi:tetraacyldisaccharide 4'-kinase
MHERRRRRWSERAYRASIPVLSVGNLHWGGGGKTPITAAIARYFRDRGLSVTILSRGYGRRSRHPLVVSRGAGPEVGFEEAGDEPILLARECPGVSVVVAAERRLAAELAQEVLTPAPELFVLDDGFSHVAMARDLDLLVFPSADPLAGARLFPSGRLREPLASARFAQALLLTGVPERPAPDQLSADDLAAALAPYGFVGPAFSSRSCPRLGSATSDSASLSAAEGHRVLLVSAVARPSSVESTALALGLDVVEHIVSRDHHSYPAATCRRIEERFRELRAAGRVDAILVTGKDLVKLEGRLEPEPLVVELVAEPEAGFFSFLDGWWSRIAAERGQSRES